MANSSEEFRVVLPGVSQEEGRLPRQYTAEGQGAKKGISPPVEWYNVPDGTKSLALVVQAIDAPEPEGPEWTIWVVENIPATLKGLPAGFSGKEEAAGGEHEGIKEGNTDMKRLGWQPPKMPTQGGHRIEFKLYALDDELNLGNKVTKDKLLDAMEGHVLGEAVFMANF
ncbi:hypothetical protein ACS0TY_015443 [Phlomoides rotata]